VRVLAVFVQPATLLGSAALASMATLATDMLRINAGGSVHTPEELDRVRALLALAE